MNPRIIQSETESTNSFIWVKCTGSQSETEGTNSFIWVKCNPSLGSGITLTPEKGYYSTDAVDTYILDFDDSDIQSKFDSYLSDTKAGFLLLGGLDLTSR